jgi:F0F1-type ATP synthase assembly protein I
MRGFGAAYGLLVSTLLGGGLGYGVDLLTHRAPLGLVAGIFLGFAAGLYSLYQAMMADARTPRDKPPNPENPDNPQ